MGSCVYLSGVVAFDVADADDRFRLQLMGVSRAKIEGMHMQGAAPIRHHNHGQGTRKPTADAIIKYTKSVPAYIVKAHEGKLVTVRARIRRYKFTSPETREQVAGWSLTATGLKDSIATA